ncbi:MAG: ABC transporter substrate-binding protein, partial [Acetobacteraceae bacterium]
MTHDFPPIGRREFVLTLAIPAVAVAVPWHPAVAATDSDADVIAPVQRLDAALLVAMRAGQGTPFEQRYAALAPVVDQTFDLNAVLAGSIGLRWSGLPNDQKAQLLAAFRRYSVASYTASFNHFSGQAFQVLPTVRPVGNGEVIVQSKLVSGDGSVTPLNYVMRNGPSGWKAVDVLVDGSISRVAVQRSDFRSLLE